MPGIRHEDREITRSGNQLPIRGKRDQEHEQDSGRFHTHERPYGSLSRSSSLPGSADLDNIRSEGWRAGDVVTAWPVRSAARNPLRLRPRS